MKQEFEILVSLRKSDQDQIERFELILKETETKLMNRENEMKQLVIECEKQKHKYLQKLKKAQEALSI